MLQKVLSISLMLILAGAGLNLAAGTGQAASRGGGDGGGYHGGGHSGGFHGAAQSGGFHGGFQGGTHVGGYQGSFHTGNLANFLPGAHYRTSTHHNLHLRSHSGFYGAWPYLGYYYPTYPNYSDSGYGYGPGAGGPDVESGLSDFPDLDNDPVVIPVP